MKILFVHERFGAFGGAEANVLVTGRELKRRGHEVALLHGAPTGQAEALWTETFSICHPIDKDAVGATQEALWQFEPDVVFVHKLPNLPVLEALVASGTPLVRMIHDHDLCCMRSYKYFVLNRRICQRPVSAYCMVPCGAFLKRQRGGLLPLRWVSYAGKRRELELNRRFHRLLVATLYMKGELLRNGFDPTRIEVLPPATQAPVAEVTASFSERNRIVYAGQVIRGKGVDVLLESLAQVRTPFECFILGDGNHRAHCEALSHRLNIADRVRFLGFLPQEQLAEHYAGGSLAVMSSVWPEPFGAVGLEAMRYGLPVVGFDAGGIREWLISGYNGYLVPWMDRAAFATRVEELLLNKKRAREMGERGRRLVDNKFNFAAYISNLEKTLGEVVTEGRERAVA
jgi:glycosyltransferase involved in cell wall biosynthesis